MLAENFFFFLSSSTACDSRSDTWGRLSVLQANQGDVLRDGTLLGFCRLRVVSSLPLVYRTWKSQVGNLVLYFIGSNNNSFAAVLEYVRPGKLLLKNDSDLRSAFA